MAEVTENSEATEKVEKIQFCSDIENKVTAITSLVIYEDVVSETTSFQNTASVQADMASIDTDSEYHLVMGYTKIKLPISSESQSDGTTKDIVVYLEPVKVEYDKQVYKPGLVKVHMSIVGGSPADYAKYVKTLFLSKKCNVSLVSVNSAGDAYHFIAKWYYVHSVSLSRRGNSSSEVTLMCYSPDKKLTLDKFCKVYSGQRLGQDIIKDTLTNTYGFVQNSAPDNGDSDHFYCDVKDLLYLGHDKNYAHDDANDDEMIQPYLVQYNETFYDLICRVANRSGEFLCYEDGTLRLGLPESTRNVISDQELVPGNATKIDVTVLHPVKVTYPELGVDYQIDSEAEIFHYNYTRQDKDKEKDRLDDGENDGKLKGYTVDPNYEAGSTSKYYNPTIATDDPLYCFFCGDIPDVDVDFKGYTAVSAVSKFASMESWVTALGYAAWDVLYKNVSRYDTPVLNLLFSKRRLQKAEFEDLLYKDSDGNIDVKKNFTMMKSIFENLCSKFYESMERVENQVTREMVTMDFNSNTPEVLLGSPLNLCDSIHDVYVVTAMRGEFTRDSRKHIVEAVPALKKEATNRLGRANATALIIPPNVVPHIREASVQEAVVKENIDPLELGRVRVRYMWQNDNDTNLSPWLRMVTPFASGIGGMIMTPEVDSHVMVNYMDCNMEKPYIDGALFCRDHIAPGFKWEYEDQLPFSASFFPTSKVRVLKSASGHGITFFDGNDLDFLSNHILPLTQLLLKPFGFNVEPVNFGGMVLSDTSGFYSIKMNSVTRTVDINSPLGKVNINAFTGINIMAPNGDINIKGKNVNITAGNNITLKAGANIEPEDVPLHTQVLSGLGALTELLATIGVNTGSTMLATTLFNGVNVAQLADVSFIRSLWEVIMRPVEGTLGLETMRNITMKAGKGKTYIPSSLLRNVKDDNSFLDEWTDGFSGLGFQENKERSNVAIQTDFLKIVKMLQTIDTAVNAFFNEIDAAGRSLVRTFRNLREKRELLDNCVTDDLDAIIPLEVTVGDLYEALKDKTENLEYNIGTMVKENNRDAISTTGVFHLCELYNETIKEKENLKAKLTEASFLKKINSAISKFTFTDQKVVVSFLEGDTIATGQDFKFSTIIISWYFTVQHYTVDRTAIPNITKLLFFKAICQFENIKIIDLSDIERINYNNVLANWDTFRNNLKAYKEPEKTKWEEFKSFESTALANTFSKTILHSDEIKKLLNWNGAAGYRAVEDVTSGGSILMSNEAGTTLRLEPDGKQFKPFQNPDIGYVKDYLDLAFHPDQNYLDIDTL